MLKCTDSPIIIKPGQGGGGETETDEPNIGPDKPKDGIY